MRVCLFVVVIYSLLESFRFEYENEYEYEFTSVLTLRMRSSPWHCHGSGKLVVRGSSTTRFWPEVVLQRTSFESDGETRTFYLERKHETMLLREVVVEEPHKYWPDSKERGISWKKIAEHYDKTLNTETFY